ncbi:hypothetical protein GWK48_00540 [Metallosphaera tengchongensis]|uniref:Uncharacterized protein n=1 Tax=Metallosphaera tengchongensis TaxID=1532350 RepID=A0A6N0NQD9_9CREN|nr:hypothetical protein [Metallosphaera tengchongensis]QKQ99083.1 hypothetical protein GWK48_00540 [Metallosphaera tengchongensis]
MRAISVPVFMVLMFILLVAVIVPAFLLFQSVSVYSSQGSQQASAYSQGQGNEINQVFRGNPNIYYNSTEYEPHLEFLFTSTPYPFNITRIYYFNGSEWVPTLRSLVVAGDSSLPLPSKSFNMPVLLVSGQGNIYFLNPNTSVDTVNIQGPSGKFPVYVASFVENGSKIYPVTTTVNFAGNVESTPFLIDVLPGNYPVDEVNQYVFLSQYGITGVFQNWSVVGYGTLSATNALSTVVTVSGPVVLTAIYKGDVAKYSVTIKPWDIPLEPNTTSVKVRSNTLTLSSLNATIPVKIDNRIYYLNSSGITLNLSYGYHIVQFPHLYNISFNYSYSHGGGKGNTPNSFFMEAGQINCYNLSNLRASTTNITPIGLDEVFVNGSGTVYGVYKNITTYYGMLVNNSFFLPAGYNINNQSVLGDFAGQFLQVNKSFVVGPTQDNRFERLYFKSGTGLDLTYEYLVTEYGNFIISYKSLVSINQNTQSYSSILSSPINVTIYNVTSSYAEPSSTINGNGYYFIVQSPMYLTVYEEWEYEGVVL